MSEDNAARGSFSIDCIVVRNTAEEDDEEYNSHMICQISLDGENTGIRDFPVTMRAYIGAKPITFQFTKKQAMALADFMRLAYHVKEE